MGISKIKPLTSQYHSIGGSRGRGLLCLAPQLVSFVINYWLLNLIFVGVEKYKKMRFEIWFDLNSNRNARFDSYLIRTLTADSQVPKWWWVSVKQRTVRVVTAVEMSSKHWSLGYWYWICIHHEMTESDSETIHWRRSVYIRVLNTALNYFSNTSMPHFSWYVVNSFCVPVCVVTSSWEYSVSSTDSVTSCQQQLSTVSSNKSWSCVDISTNCWQWHRFST